MMFRWFPDKEKRTRKMTGLGMEARQTTSSWNETDTFPQSHDLFDVDWTLFAKVVFCLAAHSKSLETETVIP